MLILTSDIKLDYQVLGIVIGSRVQAANVFKDIGSSLKSLVGGELKSYSNLLSQARDAAKQEMIKEAEKLGANAIISVRFSASSITQNASEIIIYGTAVKIK